MVDIFLEMEPEISVHLIYQSHASNPLLASEAPFDGATRNDILSEQYISSRFGASVVNGDLAMVNIYLDT